MDFLQMALIFLIALLSIFLSIMGIQVFFILKDLKRGLDRFNNILQKEQPLVQEKVATIVSSPKPKGPMKQKFYKRSLKTSFIKSY